MWTVWDEILFYRCSAVAVIDKLNDTILIWNCKIITNQIRTQNCQELLYTYLQRHHLSHRHHRRHRLLHPRWLVPQTTREMSKYYISLHKDQIIVSFLREAVFMTNNENTHTRDNFKHLHMDQRSLIFPFSFFLTLLLKNFIILLIVSVTSKDSNFDSFYNEYSNFHWRTPISVSMQDKQVPCQLQPENSEAYEQPQNFY